MNARQAALNNSVMNVSDEVNGGNVGANVNRDLDAPTHLSSDSEKQDQEVDEAEALSSVEANDSPNPLPSIECPVCLQPCIHPVQLPCNHVFCFLCVKGVANRSKRCALCRQEIPLSYFHNPKLVRQEELLKNAAFEDGYQWFYEGRNGWWQYDERTSFELEEKYKKEEKTFELLIAGFLYVIDLDSMLQYRRNDPTRRRRIKRDLESIPEKKGVAGLRTVTTAPNARQGAYGLETSRTNAKSSGQAIHAGGGQGDHLNATGTGGCSLSPTTMIMSNNSAHNQQSPSDDVTTGPSLSSAMENSHINHAGDGRSTSPEPRSQLVGIHRSRSAAAQNRRTNSQRQTPDDSVQDTQSLPQDTNSGGSSTAQTDTVVRQMPDNSSAPASGDNGQSVIRPLAENASSLPPDTGHQRLPRRQATEGHSDGQENRSIVRSSQSSSRASSPPRPTMTSRRIRSVSDPQVGRTDRQLPPGEMRRTPRVATRSQQKK